MPRSDLCDFSDAYIVAERDTTLKGDNDANKQNKNLAFKNNELFINFISKINCVKIDNAQDLMPIYNLPEYSKNYRKATGSFWNYYSDELSNLLSVNSESFKYKTSIARKTPQGNDSLINANVAIPLKYLSNFWGALDIPLINCEVELILICLKIAV